MAQAADVELYIYDLSQGMAAMMSQMLLGHKVDGIWHTAIVVYGREYFFGSSGVESCIPGGTVLGQPLEIKKIGETFLPYAVFREYLDGLSGSSFVGSTYNLLSHNCNNFSDELANFLCGTGIPKYILDLPDTFLNSTLIPAVTSLIERLEQSARPLSAEQRFGGAREPSPDFLQLNSQIEEARRNSSVLEERRNLIKEKLARKERKREKKRRKLLKVATVDNNNLTPTPPPPSSPLPKSQPEVSTSQSSSVINTTTSTSTASAPAAVMAETEAINGAVEPPPQPLPSEQAIQFEEEERKEEEEYKKAREPPIIYKDVVDLPADFDALVGLIDGKLNEEEQRSLEELHQYMIGEEGSWALGEGFLNFLGRLLHDKSLPVEVRVLTLNVLACAALKDDVILLLHQDRREHVIMNYAYDVDRLSPEEQQSLALFIVNMFENLSASEWLMYISEWTFNNQQTSNIRVTTKVAVHCLLSDLPVLQERGSAIVHNLACKEVFDDVAVELTMALLQYFNSKLSEEHLFRCMKALAKFTQISGQDVPQLIQMIGPNPNTFKGTSERVDELITVINKKLRF